MWYLLAGFAGSLVGIVLMTLCTSSRVSELEGLVETLRLQNRNLENRLCWGQGRRAGTILGTRHEDAAAIRREHLERVAPLLGPDCHGGAGRREA